MTKFILLLLISFFLIGCSNSNFYFSNISDPYERIDKIDGYFSGVNKAQDHIPWATPKNWYKMQEGFYEAYRISNDSTILKNTRDYAKYVLAFGYHISGFYDFCRSVQEDLIINVNDSLRKALLKDMSNNYHIMGEFQNYLNTLLEMKKTSNYIEDQDYNNLALAYLKVNRYKECIESINKIPLTEESSITRVTSASAYGYNKEYVNARSELQKAVQAGNKRAQKDLDDISTYGDSLYWYNDYKTIVLSYSPNNLIPQSDIAKLNHLNYSEYAPIKWFDETFILYGGTLHNLDYINSNLDYINSLTPFLPEFLSGMNYSFVLLEGIPFLVIENANSIDGFNKLLSQYSKQTESKSKFIFVGSNMAVFYNADWQKEILLKAFTKK